MLRLGDAEAKRSVYNAFATMEDDDGELLFPNFTEFWSDKDGQDGFVRYVEQRASINPMALYSAPYDTLSEQQRERMLMQANRRAGEARAARHSQQKEWKARETLNHLEDIHNGVFNPAMDRPPMFNGDEWLSILARYEEVNEQDILASWARTAPSIDAFSDQGKKALDAWWTKSNGTARLAAGDESIFSEIADYTRRANGIPTALRSDISALINNKDGNPALTAQGLRAAATVRDVSKQAFAQGLEKDWGPEVAAYALERRLGKEPSDALASVAGSVLQRYSPDLQAYTEANREILATSLNVDELDVDWSWGANIMDSFDHLDADAPLNQVSEY